MSDSRKVLEINNLNVHYFTPRGAVIATNAFNLFVKQGEIVGLVGESGCGKTTVAMSILQMVSAPGRIVSGEIKIEGHNIVNLPERELRKIRWSKLALIPQGAMNSLNPVIKIREQMEDGIIAHERISRSALRAKILKLLNDVGLPERVYNMFPHELSGGMKQRVCIAMAVALNPAIIIADEPTSALDVVVQRVVAQTLLDVKNRLGVSMIMIGHDMGLLAQMVDRVAVMYAGNLVEVGPVESIFEHPYHPYTQLLIDAIPSTKQKKPLRVTEGLTHDLRNPPQGCCFQFRCPFVRDACRMKPPAYKEMEPEHFVACVQY
ncbi:MAG: ABC transporter ATP-binding protein [Chloroflexi bacterium]|nr:ABC transporter ATP-binding protein [Chloroflexota bacterium]